MSDEAEQADSRTPMAAPERRIWAAIALVVVGVVVLAFARRRGVAQAAEVLTPIVALGLLAAAFAGICWEAGRSAGFRAVPWALLMVGALALLSEGWVGPAAAGLVAIADILAQRLRRG